MRVPIALSLILFAAACGRNAETQNATTEVDGRIDCRIGGDTQFIRACRIERTRGEDGILLTVTKPDEGVRRLMQTRDGRGVIAADGAEQAEVRIVGENLIEVSIAGDSFRLPARIGPVPQQGQ